MASYIYQILANLGYHHPLHPALTHIPVGLTLAGFIFIFIGHIRNRSKYVQTARHCAGLALLMAVPTAIMGYLDWQHFYAGADLLAIKVKIALALVLFALLSISVALGRRLDKRTAPRAVVQLLSVLAVAGLGFFGGELVYGKKTATIEPEVSQLEAPGAATTESIAAGQNLFSQNCSFCHFTGSSETKVGPGLKGLFQKDKLTGSGWPVTPENVSKQIKTPFEQMPSFDRLTVDEINSLIDYLKSL